MRSRYVATIGVFDGLHWGHQRIIGRVVQRAQIANMRSLVVTFWPHPRLVLGKEFDGYLMHLKQKKQLLKSMGVDRVWVKKSTPHFLKSEGYSFIKMICSKYDICQIIVGHDFKFGFSASSSVKDLKQLSTRFNFTVTSIKKIAVESKTISSSYIRALIRNGQIAQANRLLHRNYCIEGTVIRNLGVGTHLGFPTANIGKTVGFVLPKSGVYSAYTQIGSFFFLSAVYVGVRPTLTSRAAKKISIETHLIDFQRDITGKRVKILFLKKLRNEKKFRSQSQLAESIQQDIRFITSRYSVRLTDIPQLIVS